MEFLNTLWEYVVPVSGGVTIGALFIATLVPLIRGSISKVVSRLDIEKIEEKAVSSGIERIKTISFQTDIQPLVKSELVKIVEIINSELSEKLGQIDEQYARLVGILAWLSSYFDNSIAVSDSAKEGLKKAIAEASKFAPKKESAEIKAEIAEIKKETKRTTIAVER